jgi:hypothetical protein
MACAHAVDGNSSNFQECGSTDRNLRGCLSYWFGGVFGKHVYELPIIHKPDYCIAQWEAINILLALCVFSSFIQGRQITIWCDNNAAVSILSSGRGADPLLQCIARNL